MRPYYLVILVALLIIAPVSARASFSFEGPTNCVSPGDTVTYYSNFGVDPNNLGDWDVSFNWNPQLMDFVGVQMLSSPNPYCDRRFISQGQVICDQAGFGGSGTLKLQVKDDVSSGLHIPVTSFGTYNGDNYGYGVTKTVNTVICSANSVPEFPSLAFPITMIIGFVGAVLLIQRTRKH